MEEKKIKNVLSTEGSKNSSYINELLYGCQRLMCFKEGCPHQLVTHCIIFLTFNCSPLAYVQPQA